MKTREQLVQERHEMFKVWNIECEKRDAVFWLPQILIDANTFEFKEDGVIRGESKSGWFLYKPLEGLLKTYTNTKEGGSLLGYEWVDNRKIMKDYLKSHPEENISTETLLDIYPVFNTFHLTAYMKGFLEGIKRLNKK